MDAVACRPTPNPPDPNRNRLIMMLLGFSLLTVVFQVSLLILHMDSVFFLHHLQIYTLNHKRQVIEICVKKKIFIYLLIGSMFR